MLSFRPLMIVMVLFSIGLAFNSVQANLNNEVGGLYAGTANPGVVYKYAGGTEWEPIFPVLTHILLLNHILRQED